MCPPVKLSLGARPKEQQQQRQERRPVQPSAAMPVATPHRRSHSASNRYNGGGGGGNSDMDEIFNIDFNEIFAPSNLSDSRGSTYRGINLPKKPDRSHMMMSPQQSPLSKVRRIHDTPDLSPSRPPPPSQFSSSLQKQQQQSTPSAARTTNVRSPTEENFDADLLIEQLMKEAEADPKLRAMSGLGGPKKKEEPLPPRPAPIPVNKSTNQRDRDLMIREKVERQHQKQEQMRWNQQKSHKTNLQDVLKESRQQQPSSRYDYDSRPSLPQVLPVMKTSGRQEFDSRSSMRQEFHSRPAARQEFDSRPSVRQDLDSRPAVRQEYESRPPPPVVNRSRSADTRRRPSDEAIIAQARPAAPVDPRLVSFKRSASNDNFTEEIMHGVVTDQQHHSVKDLVAMIERNTKAESANPYVRKWGCDLISPEPHTKNVTYRREKKEFSRRAPPEQYRKKPAEREDSFDAAPPSNGNLESNFRMSSHVTEMDQLLGRQQSLMDDVEHCVRPHEVTWPPPSPVPDEHPSRSPVIRKDEFEAAYGHEEQEETKSTSKSLYQPFSSAPVVKKPPPAISVSSSNNASSYSSKKTTNDLETMASDIDKSINSFQSGFASQLDSILKDSAASNKSTAAKSSYSSNAASSQKKDEKRDYLMPERGNRNLSDDEGTYQALSVIYQDKKKNKPPKAKLKPGRSHLKSYETSFGHDNTNTDDELDDFFRRAPTPSQGPIMLAAHDLHQEVRQWSSTDNDIIAAAKRMALLMAKLSQLVGANAPIRKKELLACAKSIVDASGDVTRIAQAMASQCTDKRMRISILQAVERIPTMATQLKVLSTVKTTLMGKQETEEDIEATEMLVLNAQNIMQAVKMTVTAAEAASIKIRTDVEGLRCTWNRKHPWYEY